MARYKIYSMLRFVIASIVMFFASLMSAYIINRQDCFWVKMDVPTFFLISTIILLLISICFVIGKNKVYHRPIIFTICLCSICFVYSQYKAWRELSLSGNVVVGNIIHPTDNVVLDVDGKKIILIYDRDSNIIKSTLHDELVKVPFDYRKDTVLYLSSKYIFSYKNGFFYSSKDRQKKLNTFEINETGMLLLSGIYNMDYAIMFGDRALIKKGTYFYFEEDPNQSYNDQIANYRNNTSAFIYMLSFLHLLHILGGIVILMILGYRSIIKRTSLEGSYIKFYNTSAYYWHFLFLLWILLLLLLFVY